MKKYKITKKVREIAHDDMVILHEFYHVHSFYEYPEPKQQKGFWSFLFGDGDEFDFMFYAPIYLGCYTSLENAEKAIEADKFVEYR